MERLTEREKEVLNLLALGLSNNEISNKLYISSHTTKAHIENIYKKFGVHNKVQAVVFAVSKKLIKIYSKTA